MLGRNLLVGNHPPDLPVIKMAKPDTYVNQKLLLQENFFKNQ